MKVFTVIGTTGSGKTTTVEKLIGELKRRRFTVGSVKEIHCESFAIDTPGTNTDRHRQAGSSLVTARGRQETDILHPRRLPIREILDAYSQDWVVLEGVRDINAPKIICAHDLAGAERLLDGSALALAGQVANTGLKEYKGLPVLSALTEASELADLVIAKTPRLLPEFTDQCCGLCGMSCQELLAAMLRGEKQEEDCCLKSAVELTIGGRKVTIVPFVQTVLARTLTGLVSTLDGYRQNQEITLTWNPSKLE